MEKLSPQEIIEKLTEIDQMRQSINATIDELSPNGFESLADSLAGGFLTLDDAIDKVKKEAAVDEAHAQIDIAVFNQLTDGRAW